MTATETLVRLLATSSSAIVVDRWTPASAAIRAGKSEIRIVAVAAQGLYICEFYRNYVLSGKLRTASVDRVLACVNAWLIKQATLREVHKACAEFEPLPAGFAFEEGTLRELCWSSMDRALPAIRDVALAARAEPVLRTLYPSFSLTRLRLASAFAGPDCEILVSVLPGPKGNFDVISKDGRVVGTGDVRWAVATMVRLAEAERAGRG
jgi:hypothetical protein